MKKMYVLMFGAVLLQGCIIFDDNRDEQPLAREIEDMLPGKPLDVEKPKFGSSCAWSTGRDSGQCPLSQQMLVGSFCSCNTQFGSQDGIVN